MKKMVFCLVTLALILPNTALAEESTSTTENSNVESSSVVESTQNTENNSTITKEKSFSSTKESNSTEISEIPETDYDKFMTIKLVVLQGEKITAEMLQNTASSQGATFKDLEILEEAPTEQLGFNTVKVSVTDAPSENEQGKKITMGIGYLVAKAAPSYHIQFISYDAQKNEVKGRIISIDGSTPYGIYIDGCSIADHSRSAINSIKELYPLVAPNHLTATDAEGYFTIPYQDSFSFAAYSYLSGAYSPIYTLTDKAFAGASETADSSKLVKNTESSSEKKEEKKKGLFPNTGEKKTVYYSIAGIAIILLAILFLFIKSKKNKG